MPLEDKSNKKPGLPRPPSGAKPGVPLPPSSRPAAWTTPDSGAASIEDGYGSDADPGDHPKSYFESMSRDRDRQNNPSRDDRQRQRELAGSGWEADAKNTGPGFYVRGDAHKFEQTSAAGAGLCKSICGAYIYLRHLGYSVQKTITVMKSKVVAAKFPAWQREFMQAHRAVLERESYSELSGVAAKLYSHIAAELRASLHRFPERLNPADPLEKLPKTPLAVPDIFFEQIIGQFAHHTLRLNAQGMQAYQTAIQIGDNVVKARPHAPSSQRVDTLQEALFSSYQPCVKSIVPQQPGKEQKGGRNLLRSATPFVQLSLYFHDEQKMPAGHSVVVDFSDAAHPGIFDPNFGWMEPRQGHCFLSLEQALYTIWQFYTRNKSASQGAGGVKHLARLRDPQTYMIARQIFVQSGLNPGAGN
jgi:hypothetical protein